MRREDGLRRALPRAGHDQKALLHAHQGMNVLASDRRSPLGFFPGRPTPGLNDCVVQAL
jgi:hypothetical protein